METKKFSMGLGTKILIGIIIGLAIGFLSPTFTETISPLGKVFLRMLKMLIVPLVFFSIISGICKMGDVRQLITVGLRFVAYILISSGIAAAAGSFAGIALNVGGGTTEFLSAGAKVESVEYNFINNVISWFPENIVNAMVKQDMLQIIVFAIFLGCALLILGKEVAELIRLLDQCAAVMLKITDFVMAFSPIGITSLMATMVTTISGATVKDVLLLIAADYLTCGLVLVILYPLILKVAAGISPLGFFRRISEPMLVVLQYIR